MRQFETRLFGQDFDFTSGVRVTGPGDLSGDLRSDVVYFIDGNIDMGATQIKVPQGGLTLRGLGRDVSSIFSAENSYTMFIDPDVGYAGDIFMQDMFLTVSGTGSQVYDLDNQQNGGAAECVNFNFVGCTSLGTLNNYRQGLWDDFALIACADGLTIDGTWSGGFAILTSVVVSAGTPFTGTVLKKGASLVVNGSIRSDINALQLDGTGAVCDFEPTNITNDAEFRMIGVRTNAASTSFPNMPSSSVKARFSNCVGTRNTYVGGQWKITATASTSTTAATPVKIAGTTTYDDLQWFSQTTDNAFVYDGTDDIEVNIIADLSFDGTNGHKIKTLIRKWDDSASSYVTIASSGQQTMSAGNRVDVTSIHGFAMLSTNDRIEMWVENDSNGSVTAALDGLVSINERPS